MTIRFLIFLSIYVKVDLITKCITCIVAPAISGCDCSMEITVIAIENSRSEGRGDLFRLETSHRCTKTQIIFSDYSGQIFIKFVQYCREMVS